MITLKKKPATSSGSPHEPTIWRAFAPSMLEMCLVVMLVISMCATALGLTFGLDGSETPVHPRPYKDTYLDSLPKIGTLARVEYLWSEGRYERGFGVHAHSYRIRPHVQASVLILTNGQQVIARGQVPDYAYDAPVYKRLTDEGLLSDYCIGGMLNDCYPPALNLPDTVTISNDGTRSYVETR